MVSKILCIEIGRKTARVAEVLPAAKQAQVYHLFELPVPEGVYSEGILRKNTEFIDALKEELARREIKTKRVIFTVNAAKIAIREVIIPKIREAHIRESLITNSKNYFPVDISEYEMGYRMLEKVKEGKKEQLRLSVAVVPKDLLQGYMEMAKACELKFAGLDYMGNSIATFLLRQKMGQVNVYIKAECDSILFLVYAKEKILFQRMLPYGLEDAEDDQSMEAPIESISNMFNYYNANFSKYPVQQVYVDAGDTNSGRFMELLGKNLSMEIKKFPQPKHISYWDKGVKDVSKKEYVGVIGAAYMPLFPVGDEKRGIQEQLNTKEATRVARYLCGICVAAAVLLAAIPFLYGVVQKIRISAIESEIASYATEQRIFETYEETMLGYEDIQNLYSHTENANENMVSLLEEMEEKLPKAARIVSFTGDETTVSINVELSNKEAAAATLVQLRTFPQFSSVVTGGLNDEKQENGASKITMNIVMTYSGEGGAADETVN